MRIPRSIIHLLIVGVLLCPSLSFAYDILPVENGATITGAIHFTGSAPAPRMFQVQKNPEICGEQRPLVKVDVTDGLLTGAVVVIEGIQQGKPFLERTYKAAKPGQGEFFHTGGSSTSLEVRLQHCNFGPFTGVLPTQNPVQFANQDDIKHTLHTYVARGKRSNILRTVHNRDLLAHTATKQVFTEKVLKEGHVVAFTCDRHEFMENWLYIVTHPYYAVSDQQGQFAIDQIPPGRYTLTVWHPVLGTRQQEINLTSHSSIALDIDLKK